MYNAGVNLIQKGLNMLKKIVKSALVIAFAITASTAIGNASETKLQKIVKKGTLVLGTSGNMSPMTRSIDDGKSATGFDIDMAKAMAASMGVKLEIKVIDFEKLIPALKRGKIDMIISNMTITPQRNTEVAFVGPYFTSGKCLITKEASLASAKKDELNKSGAKMVVLKGTTDEKFVKIMLPDVVAVTVTTQEEAVAMVRDSKVSAMLSEFPICQSIITNNPDDKFVAAFSKLTYEPIGIAIAPENTHLANWTHNFLVRAKTMGLLDLIAAKWFK